MFGGVYIAVMLAAFSVLPGRDHGRLEDSADSFFKARVAAYDWWVNAKEGLARAWAALLWPLLWLAGDGDDKET